jgi:hypothetical protein
MFATDRKGGPVGTPVNFMAFEESERACKIKRLLEMGDVDFPNILNPYGD